MKIFLDTADIDEIRAAHDRGLIDGVTTNPSLAAKTDRPLKELLAEIGDMVDGPVHAEVLSLNDDLMIAEGRELSAIHHHVIVKLPLTPDGLRAARTLHDENIKTNVTLCFSPSQALFAARAGAAFVSPFIGRLDDIGSEGMQLVEDIRTIYDNYGYDTEILVASARNPMHFVNAAKIGADAITLPYNVLMALIEHPLTKSGLDRFLDDAQKSSTGKTTKSGSTARRPKQSPARQD